MFIIPFISALLYLAGGQWNKWLRWGMGIPIFMGAIAFHYSWISIFAILAYFIATNVFSYGENSWTTKLLGKWLSMALAGLAMGLASIVVLGGFWGLIQGIVGGVSFVILKYLDDYGNLHNPYQELLRGFFGTILYIGG